MLQQKARILFALIISAAAIGLTLNVIGGQDSGPRPVEQILPQNTVLLFAQEGNAKHREAWVETAAHEAIYESGLRDVAEKVFDFVGEQMGAGRDPEITKAMEHFESHGASLAVSLPSPQEPPIPQATIVFHEAAAFEPMVIGLARNMGPMLGARFSTQQINGRTATSALIPNSPGVEVGFLTEGKHLIVVAGPNAVARSVAVLESEAPNLSSNPLWKEYNYDTAAFETTSVSWLDWEALRERFGPTTLPSPGQQTIDDVLQALGLHNVVNIAYQSGYKGKSLWSRSKVKVDGERTGLLAFANERPLKLQELPPLPENTHGFTATRVDALASWRGLTQIFHAGAKLGPANVAAQADRLLESVPQMIGLDPESELLEFLGDVVCIYSDPDQGYFGTGVGVAIELDDAAKVRSAIDRLLAKAVDLSQGKLKLHRLKKQGREVVLFDVADLQVGALAIDTNWLIAGIMPQSVEAMLLRLDGKLDHWQPSPAEAEALADLPSQFTSISIGDPRVSWQALIKLAPAAISAATAALKENHVIPPDVQLPVTMADIPPAELVVHPLFPNVTVRSMTDDGILVASRQSLPGVPLISGIGDGKEFVTLAALAGMLLPSVQSARASAQRMQSTNNLKQLALACHNYHDAYQSFPSGTHPNEKLKPDERLSWVTLILPFLDQLALYEQIDLEESWDDEANSEAAATRVGAFMHPSTPDDGVGPGPSHYVGLAGLGKDAPHLPVTHKRAGVFGINRKTSIRDIKDGTSNTSMISEASGKHGPWIAGGRATIRALTKKPYINGPDGIGGPSPGGCNVAFADGSIRFISEDIDPQVFERMTTISDGQPLR